MPAPRKRARLAGGLTILVVLLVGAVVGPRIFRTQLGPAAPAATPPLPPGPAPRAPVAWLGLNYNSASLTGRPGDFAARGIVYDREGNLEVLSGSTPANSSRLATGLARSYGSHMIPDVVVDPTPGSPGCTGNPTPRKLCLPTGPAQVSAFVRGFVATASSVLRRYPDGRVLFEPADEPWTWGSPPGTASGRRAADEYALILAALLPAARAAGVPLSDIYVPATGRLSDASRWVPDLYAAQPCLKSGPGSCGPIAGWSLHPYGLPHSTSEGIDSVPGVRADMLSGQDNLIIGEIGFCAVDVAHGKGCHLNRSDIDASSARTAVWLRETLNEAAAMHRAGWLRALLVWERSGTGWAMQNPDGTLTDQGRVLDLFADAAMRATTGARRGG